MFSDVDRLLEKRNSLLLRHPWAFMVLGVLFMGLLAALSSSARSTVTQMVWLSVVICNCCAIWFGLQQSRLSLDLAERMKKLDARLRQLERRDSP